MHRTSLVFCLFLFFSSPCFLSSGSLLTAAAISGRLHPYRRPLLGCPVLTHLLYIKVAASSHLNLECSCQVQRKKRKEKKRNNKALFYSTWFHFRKEVEPSTNADGCCKFKERRRRSLKCNVICLHSATFSACLLPTIFLSTITFYTLSSSV